MKKFFVVCLVAFMLIADALACTTAVISGKYTSDGRAMIWKVRDTETLNNRMMYFADGKYRYVGMVNSEDVEGEQVWGGANSAGFAIMNSASFNVNLDEKGDGIPHDREGVFMRKALADCASLEDFEQLLKSTPKPMGLAAHFGVIDALGGAAFYEVNNHTFTRFDANNPADAPNGYIIRTNFSFTGKKDVGYGFVRYQVAQDYFFAADAQGKLNYQTLIQDFMRCLKNPVLKRDYRDEYSRIPAGHHFVNSDDLTSRHGTSSAILIQAVKPGEPTDLATIWTTIGFPHTCLTIPVWVREGNQLPKMVVKDATGNAPLNRMAMQLKDECYPMKRSDGSRYLMISKLFNLEKSGYVQLLEPVEGEVFKATEEKLTHWRKNQPKAADVVAYYNWLDAWIAKTYSEIFDVKP
jgi:hypothetical protein